MVDDRQSGGGDYVMAARLHIIYLFSLDKNHAISHPLSILPISLSPFKIITHIISIHRYGPPQEDGGQHPWHGNAILPYVHFPFLS
jgi:hypothetical protein